MHFARMQRSGIFGAGDAWEGHREVRLGAPCRQDQFSSKSPPWQAASRDVCGAQSIAAPWLRDAFPDAMVGDHHTRSVVWLAAADKTRRRQVDRPSDRLTARPPDRPTSPTHSEAKAAEYARRDLGGGVMELSLSLPLALARGAERYPRTAVFFSGVRVGRWFSRAASRGDVAPLCASRGATDFAVRRPPQGRSPAYAPNLEGHTLRLLPQVSAWASR